MFDFDDLINTFVKMLIDVPAVRQKYQERFRYIQVDEFQDTNIAQLQMVKLLAGETQNVMAVGDDAQSIYSWRSADIRCILEFERQFEGARTVKLEQNYRSTGAILRAANRLIACNKSQRPKTLFTAAQEGWPIRTYEADSDLDEARFVVMEIKKMAAAGRKHSDFAILVRTGMQTRVFEDKLREEGVPYTVVGGPSFYDRREVQAAMSYLKLLENPKDSVSFERVLTSPRRGIGDKGYQKLLALAAQRELDLIEALEVAAEEKVLTEQARDGAMRIHALFSQAQSALAHGRPFAAVLDDMIQHSGFLGALEADDKQKEERRADNVRSIITGWYEAQRRSPNLDLRGYLDRLSLADAQDDDKGGDQVRVQTIHSSKGLEYPVVFVVGMEQGIVPNRRALDEGNLEEERRLCYVAITRARELLYLTSCRIRSDRGGFAVTEPSQFLAEALHGVAVVGQ
jgi:DNA helicase-2/ATP-dependent DNA helicase PcrA